LQCGRVAINVGGKMRFCNFSFTFCRAADFLKNQQAATLCHI
jgi:hypothetical protein